METKGWLTLRFGYNTQIGSASYVHPNYRLSDGNDIPDAGSASGILQGGFYPSSQNIILRIQIALTNHADPIRSVVLNEGEISFNQARTYYIYVNDKTRIELIPGNSHTANQITHRTFDVTNYPQNIHSQFNNPQQDVELAIASDLNSNQCEFYTP